MTDALPQIGNSTPSGPVLPEAFDQFVGDTFFRQMLKSLRSTTGKPAFLHGGQAEEIFQSQLDELLITDMVNATRDSFSGDLFKQQFPDHVPPSEQPPSDNPQGTDAPSIIPMIPNTPRQTDSNFDKNV